MCGKRKWIVHVTPGSCWENAKSKYYFLPDSLKKNGCISCATEEQLLDSAQFLYKDKLNQKILYIQPDKVKRHPPNRPDVPAYLWGLNTDAIIKVVDF